MGLKYEEAVVGKVLGEAINYITRESIQAYVRVAEDNDPIYWDKKAANEAGFSDIVAPAGYHLQNTDMKVAVGQRYYVPQGSIHVRQAITIYQPALLGDRLTTTVTIADKYEKKGRKYVTYRSTVVNQRGELVCTSDYTNILAGEE